MYRHILIATDGSEISQRAIRHGVALAKALGARVSGVHAVPDFIPPVDSLFPVYQFPSREEYQRLARIEAEGVLADVGKACAAVGVEFEPAHAVDSHPYRLILETARARGCDLICMASHGRHAISALLLGSETQKLLSHCDLPVLVVR